MAELFQHPILQESFVRIEAELGDRALALPPEEFAILRRMIHSTADFEFADLLRVSPGAITIAVTALQSGCPIVVDVEMVRQGCLGMVGRTFQNPLVAAVSLAKTAAPGQTRTETGLLRAWEQFPQAIYAIGNAPTALRALCDRIAAIQEPSQWPPLVIGVPVGFVGVLEAKAALAALAVPQIRVEGRKGGSAIAAAIVNALLVMAWEAQE